MTPIPFAEANTTLLAPPGMPDCEDLPCYRGEGMVVSLWQLTWRERFIALLFGVVWLRVNGDTQPPLAIDAMKTVFTKEAA